MIIFDVTDGMKNKSRCRTRRSDFTAITPGFNCEDAENHVLSGERRDDCQQSERAR